MALNLLQIEAALALLSSALSAEDRRGCYLSKIVLANSGCTYDLCKSKIGAKTA